MEHKTQWLWEEEEACGPGTGAIMVALGRGGSLWTGHRGTIRLTLLFVKKPALGLKYGSQNSDL